MLVLVWNKSNENVIYVKIIGQIPRKMLTGLP
jgi:hypothetical protein